MNDTEHRDRLGRLAYSVDEAAAVVGLSKTTLYNLMGANQLAFCKVGKRRIIRSVDLEALISGPSSVAA
ncbi:helix-turn-helix domain-containing protein [Sphingomonas ginsenosidivorax]|uniref:Helix-turn-helix domain-containing protein n=1 Tax=Sphingomonas ginsenosidivorax TaxID=862135 RepID=A0A5C6UCC9_9SPHN|nr:helix-turn-helix domain-containing protein [Sphingomonas ginsenosidivorax]TXC69608.1 helix-turn-helix domain-containing protein [Sphingomonas ginsenosidivorax]